MTEAAYRAFSGRASGPDRELHGRSVAQMTADVRAAAGSQKAAAAQLGVSTKTLRRWESGAVKTPKGLGGLQQAARSALRRARMGPRTEAKLRGTPDWQLTGEIKVSSEVRRRTIRPGARLPAGNLSPALDHYLAGDDAAAGAALAAAVQQYHRGDGPARPGGGMEVVDVEQLRLGKPKGAS